MASVGDAIAAGWGWRAWWLAARPRTLAAALAPVLVGSAVAAADGAARWGPALAAMAAALLLQLAANFANDVFDHEKGADTPERRGPPRAAQLGLLTPAQLKRATGTTLALAAVVGLYLVAVGGWLVLAAGALAIVAAVTYSGGPWPFGYHGLGDVAVFVFFGLVAVVGTHYVQSGALSSTALAASLPVGCLATAILVVNNLRDIDTDRRAGKRTLAVRLGRGGARTEYCALLGAAYAAPLWFWGCGLAPASVLLPGLTLPWGVVLMRRVLWLEDGPGLNATLASTARLLLGFSALLAVGWLG